MRFRSNFAYVDRHLPDGEVVKLCRLRYIGSASSWGSALYRYSHDDYEDNILPSGRPTGSPQDALDCALYLSKAASPPDTPTNECAGVLVSASLPSTRRTASRCQSPGRGGEAPPFDNDEVVAGFVEPLVGAELSNCG